MITNKRKQILFWTSTFHKKQIKRSVLTSPKSHALNITCRALYTMRVFFSSNGFRFSMNLGPTTFTIKAYTRQVARVGKGLLINGQSLTRSSGEISKEITLRYLFQSLMKISYN